MLVNKFAHVTGGADVHCLGLARGLERRGHSVALLSTGFEDGGVPRGVLVPASVTHNTREELGFVEQIAVGRRALWNETAAAGMRVLLRDFDPDVVHCHKLYPQLSAAPVVIASQNHVPVVQTLHDYEFLSASPFDHRCRLIDRNETRWRYRFLNAILLGIRRRVHLPRVTRWVAVSQSVAEAHSGILEAEVFPNFVEPAACPPRQSFVQRHGILFAGRLTEEKGVRDYVEAAAATPALEFCVVGDGDLRTYVADAARRLPNLEFRGALPHRILRDLFRSRRVVAMPSRWKEPGPLTSLEAMAAGTPIVCYPHGGLAEYVRAAGAGVTVAPDAASLAAGCASLHQNPVAWEEYSRGGLRSAEKTHGTETYLDRLIGLYEGAA